jgi:hypothetical protein
VCDGDAGLPDSVMVITVNCWFVVGRGSCAGVAAVGELACCITHVYNHPSQAYLPLPAHCLPAQPFLLPPWLIIIPYCTQLHLYFSAA